VNDYILYFLFIIPTEDKKYLKLYIKSWSFSHNEEG